MMLLPLDTMRLKREKIGLISEHLCRTTPPAHPKTLSNPHPLINPPPHFAIKTTQPQQAHHLFPRAPAHILLLCICAARPFSHEDDGKDGGEGWFLEGYVYVRDLTRFCRVRFWEVEGYG